MQTSKFNDKNFIINIKNFEVITDVKKLSVKCETELNSVYSDGALIVVGVKGVNLFSPDKKEIKWIPENNLPDGLHKLLITELITNEGNGIKIEKEIQFLKITTKVSLSENYLILHYLKLEIDENEYFVKRISFKEHNNKN